MDNRSTIKGLLSSIHGAVFYTISKSIDGKTWSIVYQTEPRNGLLGDKVRMIRGFKRRKDAMAFVDSKLEMALVGEVFNG